MNVVMHSVMPSVVCDLKDYEAKGMSIFRGSVIREGSSKDTSHLTALFKVRSSISTFPAAGLNFNKRHAKVGVSDNVDYESPLQVVEKSEFVKLIHKNFNAELLLGRVEMLLNCCLFLHSQGV